MYKRFRYAYAVAGSLGRLQLGFEYLRSSQKITAARKMSRFHILRDVGMCQPGLPSKSPKP